MTCIKTLKQKGLKLTPQRKLVIDALHDSINHSTAEELIERVQAKMPEVHKSTVYRTLELLEKNGCIYKSELDEHIIYHHSEGDHHHHLVCSKCGKIIECNDNIFNLIEKRLAEKYSFMMDFKHLVISGICEECKGKNA
jgi:Fur family ferric uptake transcriptional regulator